MRNIASDTFISMYVLMLVAPCFSTSLHLNGIWLGSLHNLQTKHMYTCLRLFGSNFTMLYFQRSIKLSTMLGLSCLLSLLQLQIMYWGSLVHMTIGTFRIYTIMNCLYNSDRLKKVNMLKIRYPSQLCSNTMVER